MRRLAAIAILSIIGIGASTQADTLNYEVSATSSVTANTNGNAGLAIQTAVTHNILNGSESFDLSDNQSETFNFFQIWTDESTINSDDTTPLDITASLAFNVPAGVIVTIDGQTVGADKTIKFLGHVVGTIGTGAEVTWDSLPIQVATADRTFDVSLSNTTFDSFLGVFVPGKALAGTVQATITQVSSDLQPSFSPAAVPAPASFCGGSMLVGLMFLGRRAMRRTAAQQAC
ncbi:MAG TPA: hypothetical protein VGG19_05865 [Tepidisphaeraceae bacterium]